MADSPPVPPPQSSTSGAALRALGILVGGLALLVGAAAGVAMCAFSGLEVRVSAACPVSVRVEVAGAYRAGWAGLPPWSTRLRGVEAGSEVEVLVEQRELAPSCAVDCTVDSDGATIARGHAERVVRCRATAPR